MHVHGIITWTLNEHNTVFVQAWTISKMQGSVERRNVIVSIEMTRLFAVTSITCSTNSKLYIRRLVFVYTIILR